MSIFHFLVGPGDSGLLSRDVVEVILNEIRCRYGNSYGQDYSNNGFSIAEVSNHGQGELQVLSCNWKYLSQPRTGRLNNRKWKWPENDGTSSTTDKMPKRFFFKWKPRKILQNLKNVIFRIGNCYACVPCGKPGKVDNGQQFVLIINELNDLNSRQNKTAAVSLQMNENSEKGDRPLRQSKSIFTKVVDFIVEAFVIFLD